MFTFGGWCFPYTKLRNYLILVLKINCCLYSGKGLPPCEKTNKDLFSAQKCDVLHISCADENVTFELAWKWLVTDGFISAKK